MGLRRISFIRSLVLGIVGALFLVQTGHAATFPANQCVSTKQREAARYCLATLKTWAKWDRNQDAADRDAALSELALRSDGRWSRADERALSRGTNCSETTETWNDAQGRVDTLVGDIVQEINTGLDFQDPDQARCGSRLIRAAALRCYRLLTSESKHIKRLARDPEGEKLLSNRARVDERYNEAWDAAAASCPSGADADDVADHIDEFVDEAVLATIVSPNVSSDQFDTISPTGSTAYLGRDMSATCVFDTPYHFFAKRGTVNKVVMYYQGGGACWEQLTCQIPVCDDNVNPNGSDNPNNVSTGFADLDNSENPFRDWHIVFVSYCSCDIHYGDIAQDYDNLNPNNPLHVEHRGFQNAKIVEKWAREHFLNPEAVMVTGSSAGGYGALFHGPGLHDVWPASQFHVLGDASNGVITDDFLQNEFSNWNFEANLPADVPGVLETVSEGTGMVGYIDAVADFYPNTNWANYTSAFDGGTGGQTGFYNIMLNGNQPAAALTWWQGSCEFNRVMREQAFEQAALAPENYRYFIGSGSRHTMYGSNKVYTDVLGGVPRIVDWVTAMLDSTPGNPNPSWMNVEADPFNVLLPGDVRPSVIPTPPFAMDGSDVVINCPSP